MSTMLEGRAPRPDVQHTHAREHGGKTSMRAWTRALALAQTSAWATCGRMCGNICRRTTDSAFDGKTTQDTASTEMSDRGRILQGNEGGLVQVESRKITGIA